MLKNSRAVTLWPILGNNDSSMRLGLIYCYECTRQHVLKLYAESQTGLFQQNHAEIRQLKRELARVTEERDILKKATAYFARDAK